VANPDPKTDHLEPTQWKPGRTGNPAGSSRRQRFSSTLNRLLDEDGADEAFIRVGLKAAMDGDYRFWSYLFDRIEGKIPVEIQEADIDLEAVRNRLKQLRAERDSRRDRDLPGRDEG
jgi:hypothetical protein